MNWEGAYVMSIMLYLHEVQPRVGCDSAPGKPTSAPHVFKYPAYIGAGFDNALYLDYRKNTLCWDKPNFAASFKSWGVRAVEQHDVQLL